MIFAKNFARNFEKKIILGTSDTRSMSCSSQRPSDPAYYIKDCRILGHSSAWVRMLIRKNINPLLNL